MLIIGAQACSRTVGQCTRFILTLTFAVCAQRAAETAICHYSMQSFVKNDVTSYV